MIEQWTSTTDVRMAAGLGTLGVEIQLRRTIDTKRGADVTRFFLALKSACGRHDTRTLKLWTENGYLERKHPEHELLTTIRGMMNRERVLDLQNKGIFMELRRVKGTEIWQYVRGERGLPGVAGQLAVIKTRDLKTVAALGLMGMRLLRIAGGDRDHEYTVEAFGPERADGKPRADGAALMTAWHAAPEKMPEDCVYAQGAWGLKNRERLVGAMKAELGNILLRKPRSVMAALVREDATDAALERVEEFFEG